MVFGGLYWGPLIWETTIYVYGPYTPSMVLLDIAQLRAIGLFGNQNLILGPGLPALWALQGRLWVKEAMPKNRP